MSPIYCVCDIYTEIRSSAARWDDPEDRNTSRYIPDPVDCLYTMQIHRGNKLQGLCAILKAPDSNDSNEPGTHIKPR